MKAAMKKHWTWGGSCPGAYVMCGIFYDFLYTKLARRKADVTCGNCLRILKAQAKENK